MSTPGSPQFAYLLVGDVRYEAVEFSAAGLSLARAAVRSGKLSMLGRGDECAATLGLRGPGWETTYDVVVRFAARGPAHLGLAFVTLPPPARHRLSRPTPPSEESEAEAPRSEAQERARHAPFAYARLVEEKTPIRRLILSASEAVFAHTLARSRDHGVGPKSPGWTPSGATHIKAAADEEGPLPAGTLLVYGVVLFALLVVLLGMMFG